MRQKKISTTEARNLKTRKLADLIRSARIQSGQTEEAVAKYVGIPVSTLRAYEAATKSIPLSHVYALSNCLNISPDVIVQLVG